MTETEAGSFRALIGRIVDLKMQIPKAKTVAAQFNVTSSYVNVAVHREIARRRKDRTFATHMRKFLTQKRQPVEDECPSNCWACAQERAP